ncbi:class F sortase [Dactylosporangium roseum]|uniref:Class F sortase n=1 Tax=Dactylosporangium roseum TaxID=47989 RepID=A0ABY5ZDS4_9ACTN|nr:class F sortase [Dactylosporangium roseum]UWZ39105.1 class F sortase [Dactylosporangium roseum]
MPLSADPRTVARALLAVGLAGLVGSGALLTVHFVGHGRVGRVVTGQSLPPELVPDLEPAPGSAPGPTRSAAPARVPDRPGVPVRVTVPAHRVDARISADPLRPDGGVYVPEDPRRISWSSGTGTYRYSAPGSAQGTAILVGHVEYRGNKGAFANLSEFEPGQLVVVELSDGRRLRYSVAAAPIAVSKAQLAADLRVSGQPLHRKLFDQAGTYGPSDGPRSGRLLLASCGGIFDYRTGHYVDNIFVFALPTD